MTRIALLLAELAGMAAIVVGVARVSIPAALIVGGVLAIAAANLADRAIGGGT